MQTNQISFERKKTFDAVRAIATIAVFLFHAGYLLPFRDSNHLNRFSSETFINLHRLVYMCGTVGVSIFFVLSGFLLFYQLYKEQQGLDWKRARQYAYKRLLRILPLYYASIVIIVLFLRPYILGMPGGLAALFDNFLFFRRFHAEGAPKITINPVYWSLVIEMHFYFLLPIFYYLFYKTQRVFWFFLPVCTGVLYRLAVIFFVAVPSSQMLRLTPANFDFFAFGMLGAYLYVKRYSWLGWFKKDLVQAGSLILFLVFIYFYDLDFGKTVSYIFMPVIFGLLAMVCILSLLMNEDTKISRFLTSIPMLFIAKISFSVYIWHAIVIECVEKLSMTNMFKFILDVVFTVIISVISFYCIENPFLKNKSKPRIFDTK